MNPLPIVVGFLARGIAWAAIGAAGAAVGLAVLAFRRQEP